MRGNELLNIPLYLELKDYLLANGLSVRIDQKETIWLTTTMGITISIDGNYITAHYLNDSLPAFKFYGWEHLDMPKLMMVMHVMGIVELKKPDNRFNAEIIGDFTAAKIPLL